MTLLISIRERSGLSLGRNIDHLEVSRDFPQSIQANRGQHFKLEHDHFLQHSFQFITAIHRITSFLTERRLPQTRYTKPSAQIRKYDAEEIYYVLNSHDQQTNFGHLAEIPTYSVLEEAEKPEPEPKERTVTVL